jgi:predicted PurR-regulated permease PerM
LVTRIWGNLDPILRRYFIGVGVVVLTTSIFAYVGLGLILGIHYALFLALMTGLLETIPIVGPAASAVIAGLVAIGQARGAASILAYALYATALRITIDQVVGPIVLGRAGYVRPVVVIFCFLAGGILFGVVGVALATPIALALKVTLEEMYRT